MIPPFTRAVPLLSLFLILGLITNAQVRFENDTVYKFSWSILRNLQSSSQPDFARAAQDFSFIGDHKNALFFAAKIHRPYAAIRTADSLYFKSFHAANAKEYILKRAQKEQIIIVNEAHHLPSHRVFISSLLNRLYEIGFRYYGAETLDPRDSLLSQRGYPSIHSGYYTVEPQFGNLVRDALKIGFKVFPYEARSSESISNPERRELEQAEHIAQILKKDPTARILIHAGYDHIREDSVGGTWIKAMAGRFKEITGIDPFTINQEVLTERTIPELENPFYRMIRVDEPSVFLNDQGRVFSGPEGTHYYDVRLCHPRTRYIEQRPHWLFTNDRKPINLDRKFFSLGFPCLVQAYVPDEDMSQAVPVDVIEIQDESHMKPLALRNGSYEIVVKSPNGKSIQIPLVVR
jgi:hypothetical protein